MRLADAFLRFVERVGDGLLGRAPEIAELQHDAFEFALHPTRGLGQFHPRGGLDLDRIAPHLVEQDPQRDAGDGGSNRDAEILHDLLGRARGRKLIERYRQRRQRKEKPHVIKVVAGLVVAQPEQPRAQQNRVSDHDQHRHGGDRQRAEIVKL